MFAMQSILNDTLKTSSVTQFMEDYRLQTPAMKLFSYMKKSDIEITEGYTLQLSDNQLVKIKKSEELAKYIEVNPLVVEEIDSYYLN